MDGQGNRIEGRVVDITEKDEGDNYIRSIQKTMDPNKYKINLAEYLL
jgi:hypothetical protein